MEKQGRKAFCNVVHINSKKITELAAMGCTSDDIGAFFDCSKFTIEKNFANALKKGRVKREMFIKKMFRV